MKNLWIRICGGKPAVIAVPAVPHTNAQGVAILLGIALAGCIWWMLSGGSFPSWGSSDKPQTPAPAPTPAVQPQPAGETNPTIAEIAKLLASIPESDVRDNVVTVNGDNSNGEIHGPVIKVYPNAKVVPPKFTSSSVKIGGAFPVVADIPVVVGKNISFTPPTGVTAEWQDKRGEWHPCVAGELFNPQRVRFTSTNTNPQEFTILWSDIH